MLVWTIVAMFVRRYSLYNTQYTLTIRMEITTSRDRRFWIEFFMLYVEYDDDGGTIHSHAHIWLKRLLFIWYGLTPLVFLSVLKVCSFPRKMEKGRERKRMKEKKNANHAFKVYTSTWVLWWTFVQHISMKHRHRRWSQRTTNQILFMNCTLSRVELCVSGLKALRAFFHVKGIHKN